LVGGPEKQGANFDTLAGGCAGTAGRIVEGGMGRIAGAAVMLGVVAFQQNRLVALKVRVVEPSMMGVIGEAIGFADFVGINEIGGDEIVGVD